MKKYEPKSDAKMIKVTGNIEVDVLDFIKDKKSIIQWSYIEVAGTESHERNIWVTIVETLLAELQSSEERVRCLEEELKGMTWVADSNGKYYEEEKAKNEAMIAELKGLGQIEFSTDDNVCIYVLAEEIQSIINKYEKV